MSRQIPDEVCAVRYHKIETGIVISLVVLFSLIGFADTAVAKEDEPSKPLRAGIIGLDTSHVVAFTQLLNAATPKPEVAGVRVVAAYPGGSPDIPSSRDRVAGFTQELRDKFGVDDRRLDRRAAGAGRRRAARERRRPAASRAGYGRSSRLISRCSSTSRSPARWPMRSPSSSWLGRRTRRVSRARRLRFGPGVAAIRSNTKAGRDHRLRCLWALRSRGTSSRLVLVRGSRGRDAFHDHGYQAVRRCLALRPRAPSWSLASGTTGRIGTFRGMRKGPYKYGGDGLRHQGESHPSATTAATSRWWSRSSSSSRRASPR